MHHSDLIILITFKPNLLEHQLDAIWNFSKFSTGTIKWVGCFQQTNAIMNENSSDFLMISARHWKPFGWWEIPHLLLDKNGSVRNSHVLMATAWALSLYVIFRFTIRLSIASLTTHNLKQFQSLKITGAPAQFLDGN